MSQSSCPCGGSDPKKCTCASGGHADGHHHDHEHSHEQGTSARTPPDFSKMTQAEKNAYHQAQRDRIYGKF